MLWLSAFLQQAFGSVTRLQALFSSPLGKTEQEEQVPVILGSDSPHTASYGAHISKVIEVPDSESKRAALHVSNIIHGTAFSYGHPDARTTWKPTYHFSELDGWDSDPETGL